MLDRAWFSSAYHYGFDSHEFSVLYVSGGLRVALLILFCLSVQVKGFHFAVTVETAFINFHLEALT